MPDAPAISPATASYKWPSKVLRYKITCPFQRMLVVKHEAQIDWDGQIHGTRIESAQALDAHIKDVMLPALHRWMDPGDEKSHYCRQIDLEKMLANPAPHIQEARDLRKREGDEAARRFLLDHINRQKKEQFEGWWDYVMKGNPAYQKHPAFQYLILRPVLESSDAKTTRSPLPVNAEALAHLWDRISAGRVDPRRTKLVQLLARFMAFGDVADEEQPRFGTDCRWVVIKRTDPKAAERVAALSQGSGWCVASSSMAASYLQSSDFHLLVEDGRARVALRLAGNQAVEVQGKNNDDPGPWWPRILLYLAARGTSISHRNEQAAREGRRIGKELADAARRGTQRLGEVLKIQPAKVHLLDSVVAQDDEAAQLVVREAWLSCVRADPMCGGLLPEWMEVDAEMKRAVEEAWGALLIADPLSFQGIPKAIADSPAVIKALRTGWTKLLVNDPRNWHQCPASLQQEFRKDEPIATSLGLSWAELLANDPQQWSQCPEFLQTDSEVVKARKRGWLKQLENDPRNWYRCPEFLRSDTEVVEARKRGCVKQLENDPRNWHRCPEFLRSDTEVVKARKRGWVRQLLNDPLHWDQCPEFLQSDSEVVQASKTGWIRRLANDPREWNKCPEFLQQEFQKDASMANSLKINWTRLLANDPDQWSLCPKFLQSDSKVVKAHWLGKLKNDPRNWHACPAFLKTDAELIEAQKKGWIQVLINNPRKWDQSPEILKQEVDIIQARKTGWARLVQRSPSEWTHCRDLLKEDAQFTDEVSRKWGSFSGVIGYPNDWHWYRQWHILPQYVRENPKIRAIHTTSWTKLLRRRPEIWERAPGFVLEDEKVRVLLHVELLCKQELSQQRYPESRLKMPGFILAQSNVDDFPERNKKIWIKILRKSPAMWGQCHKALQADEKIFQACKEGWIKLLRKSPTEWNRCHESLQSDAEVVQARKTGWIRRLENDPREWNKCPEFLQQEFQKDASMANSLKISWTKLLANDQDQWSKCPEFLQSDSEVVQASKTGWIRRLANDPREWNQCPEFLQADAEVVQASKTGWIRSLEYSLIRWEHCPEFLQSDSEVAKALRKGWMKQLENDPRNWHQCPEFLQQEFQKDAAAVPKLISAWITSLQRDPDKYRECPDFLRTHTDIVQARKAGWLAWLEQQYPATRDTWIERLLKEGVLGWGDLKPEWRKGIHTDVSRLEASTFEISPDPLPPYAAASLAALAAEPRATLPVVQAWRHHPRMELTNCQKALAALRHFPQNYNALPPEQKKHALIREAAALGWADWVQKTPEAASKVPAEFQDHPEVAEQVRRAFAKCLEMKLKQVEKNPSITDEQLEHLAIPAANRKMRKTIRAIRLKYWKVQVKKDWRNWSTMPPSLQQEDEVLKVMREGLGPEIRRAPGLWARLPEGYHQDECLQRVHRFATQRREP